MQASDILHFWFTETDPKLWWAKDTAFDVLITRCFADIHAAASRGQCAAWRSSAEGRLAEIIVLDQFSRNIYRGTAEAFSQDELALFLAQEAVAMGADKTLSAIQKSFLYLPYMHSESLAVHEEALRLYAQPGLEFNLEFEHKHHAIITQFGRYPHRNKVLGRASTAEEQAFLQTPGSAF